MTRETDRTRSVRDARETTKEKKIYRKTVHGNEECPRLAHHRTLQRARVVTSAPNLTEQGAGRRSIKLIEHYEFDWRASLIYINVCVVHPLHARAMMPVYSNICIFTYVYLRPRLRSVARIARLDSYPCRLRRRRRYRRSLCRRGRHLHRHNFRHYRMTRIFSFDPFSELPSRWDRELPSIHMVLRVVHWIRYDLVCAQTNWENRSILVSVHDTRWYIKH